MAKSNNTKKPEPSKPIEVADYLLNLPISALTGRERSELWNACAAFITRIKHDGRSVVQTAEVPRGKAKAG